MRLIPLKILENLALPEYRARHIFVAKLRLAVFIGFWLLYVIFLKNYLSETKPITITILITFLITTICYYNIFNNKLLILSFTLEILSDLVAMTAIVYLTGGHKSDYYVIYIFYAVAAGLFYNYKLALLTSVLSFICYQLFLLALYYGFIPELPIDRIGLTEKGLELPYLHPILLAIFLALAVYATKIAHVFTQIRERMLEERNKELLALQQMSSTIRTVTSLDDVLTHVVSGVLGGLNLTFCLLMLQEKNSGRVRCIPPDSSQIAGKIEEILGVRLKNLYYPTGAEAENHAFRQIRQGRIIFRRDITEIVAGIEPAVAVEKFKKVQKDLNIRRVVAIPLVTSREVVGALIGFTTEAFVEAKKIQTFQAFADQAAMAVEAALLITELRKKNVELIEANRVKSEFLATMSHELRTPLTAIIGFSELLLEGVMGAMTDEQMDSLKEVLSNANSLLEMINNLLDLAKVESGKMELSRHNFDWKEMIMRVERSVAALIKRKNHKLKIDIGSDMPAIFADEKRMQQILLNLLSNAIKFTPEGGLIKIGSSAYPDFEKFSRSRDFDKDIKLDADVYGSGVVICSVEDNGIGIPQEHLSGIFDVFQQVDSSTTRSYEGSGLGLALVKEFVELHGGTVWVKSKENKGTKFSFTFPLS